MRGGGFENSFFSELIPHKRLSLIRTGVSRTVERQANHGDDVRSFRMAGERQNIRVNSQRQQGGRDICGKWVGFRVDTGFKLHD